MIKKVIKESSARFDTMVDKLKGLYMEADGIHGLKHAKRVYILTCLIANLEKMSEEQVEILNYAALYHDIGRTHNDSCDVHGKDSFIKMIKNKLIDESFTKLNTLKYVMENHCVEDDVGIASVTEYNINDKEEAVYLLKVFKDADCLDRVRSGDLDEKYLRLKSSHRLIKTAYHLYKSKKI